MASITVREATPDDRLDVRQLLDAAMLEVREDLPDCVESGDVLVAEAESILGALVLLPDEETGDAGHAGTAPTDTARIDAVAVRRARRARGIGSALIRAALAREGRLTAEFDPSVRPFYESLDFEISPVEVGEGDRLRGVRDAHDTG